ncbi:MAG: hypothetical protein ABI832_03295 [bacterium]
MSDKIDVENISHPGKIYRVDRAKYDEMRDVFLSVLTAEPPGMTPAQIIDAVRPLMSQDLFPGGETCGWWVKCVQLDLEAKGLIARAPKSPVRLHRVH